MTLDRRADAAYFYLSEEIEPGGVARTYSCDPREVHGDIHLDFDHHGKLVGIEVLDASRLLTKETLKQALVIG
jgi:uncharacterized protein YuzE